MRCYKFSLPLQILKKTAEKQIADKKLEETYKEMKEADVVAQWGIKDIKEFENKVAKGPEEPKGLISAKSYREKIVIPFLAGLNRIFKRIVKMAKSCFAESIELKKKLEQMDADRKTLIRDNDELKWSKNIWNRNLMKRMKGFMNWKNQSLCLDFLDDLLRMKTMKRLWRWGRRKGKITSLYVRDKRV